MRTRRDLLARNPAGGEICAVPWCAQPGSDPHEPLTRARGGSIIDGDNIRMVCHPHNLELTTEPSWGYVLGLLAHSWGAPDWVGELAGCIDASAGRDRCWRWTGPRNYERFGAPPWFRDDLAWDAISEAAGGLNAAPDCAGQAYCVNPAHGVDIPF